jgi:FkbM family methyltransferase
MSLSDLSVGVKHLVESLVTLRLPRRLATWPSALPQSLGLWYRPEATVRTRDGLRLVIRPWRLDYRAVHEVLVRDDYRLASSGQLDGVIIDAGANVGVFAVTVAARMPRVRVLAFEPEPSNAALLRRNVEANGLGGRVIVFEEMIGEQSGEATLYVNARSGGENSAIASPGATILRATARSLADVLSRSGVDRCSLLKMDVEGAEYGILRAAGRPVLDRIQRIHLEYHARGGSGVALRDLLHNAGFIVTIRPLLGGQSGYLYCSREGRLRICMQNGRQSLKTSHGTIFTR